MKAIEQTYQLTLDTSDLLATKCTKPMPNRAGAAYRGSRRWGLQYQVSECPVYVRSMDRTTGITMPTNHDASKTNSEVKRSVRDD